jgi:hypothetical protein
LQPRFDPWPTLVVASNHPTAFLLDRPGTHQPQRPPLKLIRVLLGQRLGIRQRHRLAHDRVLHRVAEGVAQPDLDQRDR